MTNYDDTFSARPFVLRLVVNQGTPNIAANTSPVTWALRMVRAGAYESYSFSGTNAYTAVINGVTVGSGNFTFDFRGTSDGDYITIDSGTETITHNTNGTKTLAVSASATATVVGSASKSGSKTLSTIPRASTPTFSVGGSPVTSVTAGTAFDIATNRASTSFTHTVGYVFGTQSGTIATGVATTTAWTPPLTLLTEIPSSVSGALQILVDTYSGADLIGSTTTSVTLTAGAGAVPSFSSVTHAEATVSPDVDTIVGAYVKGISSLDLAIVSPVGYQGSTIVSQKLEVAGQTITAGTGTTGVIGLSGAIDIRATVTDSRGRSYFEDVPISVLNYTGPTISSSTVARADAGGTPNADGTYIRLDVAATTQSLVVGTQRNDLKYRVRIKETTDATAWSSVSPAASSTGVGSTGYSGYLNMGPYSVADSWVVRLEVEDNLGTVSAVELTVATGGLLLHMPKDADAIGVGKYWEQGSVDAKLEMYQRDGRRVLDEDDIASTTLAGIVELATNAETQTGTDTDRAVTPAGLESVVGPLADDVVLLGERPQGALPSSVAVGSGSASVSDSGVVTFTAVSSVSLNDVFTGLDDGVYEVVIDAVTSTGATIVCQLRDAGTNYSGATHYERVATYSSTAVAPTRSTAITSNFAILVPTSAGTASEGSGTIRLYNPVSSGVTRATMVSCVRLSDAAIWQWVEAARAKAGSADGISAIVSAGTMTGTMKVMKIA